MASASLYNQFKYDLMNGVHELDGSGTYKTMLVAPTYTFDATDATLDLISGNEISGTGYASGFAGAGRKALSGRTLTKDDVNNLAKWTFDDLTWSAIDAGTFNALVIFLQPGGAADDGDCIPMVYINVGATLTDGSDETFLCPSGGAVVLA